MVVPALFVGCVVSFLRVGGIFLGVLCFWGVLFFRGFLSFSVRYVL